MQESHSPTLSETQGVFPRRERKDWRKQRGGGDTGITRNTDQVIGTQGGLQKSRNL